MQGITIIIPFYKREKITQSIIELLSFEAYRLKLPIEILVVDSHTTSHVLDCKEVHNSYCSIKILHTYNNLAAKRNHGIKNSMYEKLVFLDDDCIPMNNFLKNIKNCC